MLTITNQIDITRQYTPIPPLTASLVYQNAVVGRLCGIVKVILTPIMGLSDSFVNDHEDDQIPNMTFDVQLDDGSTTSKEEKRSYCNIYENILT